jgi:homoprotocatechuate degradation regulator HpaR
MTLMRAREGVMSRFRPILAEHGITEQQWRVLRALSDGPMLAGELAGRTCLLGPSLSRMLVSMDDRGLIVRTLDRSDGRRTEIAIAPAGRALVERIAPESERVYSGIERTVGTDELAELHRLLDRLAQLS